MLSRFIEKQIGDAQDRNSLDERLISNALSLTLKNRINPKRKSHGF